MKNGALKRVDKSYWVHVACVNLIPEIHFSHESQRKEEVREAAKIPGWRYSQTCCFCGLTAGVSLFVLSHFSREVRIVRLLEVRDGLPRLLRSLQRTVALRQKLRKGRGRG